MEYTKDDIEILSSKCDGGHHTNPTYNDRSEIIDNDEIYFVKQKPISLIKADMEEKNDRETRN